MWDAVFFIILKGRQPKEKSSASIKTSVCFFSYFSFYFPSQCNQGDRQQFLAVGANWDESAGKFSRWRATDCLVQISHQHLFLCVRSAAALVTLLASTTLTSIYVLADVASHHQPLRKDEHQEWRSRLFARCATATYKGVNAAITKDDPLRVMIAGAAVGGLALAHARTGEIKDGSGMRYRTCGALGY